LDGGGRKFSPPLWASSRRSDRQRPAEAVYLSTGDGWREVLASASARRRRELSEPISCVSSRDAACAAPRGEATGFRGDAEATAKRDLAAGETLDGEGGFTVYGRLMPAAPSLARGALPIGLAHGVTLTRAVKAGACVRWADVAANEGEQAVQVRREMEALFRREWGNAPGERGAAAE
jgi:predicted homoserine dehydrogenase-like protein